MQAISRTRATIRGGPAFAFDLCVSKITPEHRSTLDISILDVAFIGAEHIHFFFSSRRLHTISLRDWSSDVCSSDLARRLFVAEKTVDHHVSAVLAKLGV